MQTARIQGLHGRYFYVFTTLASCLAKQTRINECFWSEWLTCVCKNEGRGRTAQCKSTRYSPTPMPPLSRPVTPFSLFKRWRNEAGWAFKPSLGKNLEEQTTSFLKNYSNLGRREEKERASPDLGVEGLGSLLDPHCPAHLDGHHFLELWVLALGTPTSSLDL